MKLTLIFTEALPLLNGRFGGYLRGLETYRDQ
jgi:hypothetical protein